MTNKPAAIAVALMAAQGLAMIARADSTVIVSSRDNTLYQSTAGDLSNGAGSGMFAGRNAAASNSIRRALVWFDVAGQIPAGSTITSVTLSMYNSAANADEAQVSLHRALENWGEGTSSAGMGGGGGAPATPGDATWLFRSYPGSPWSTPGGTFAAGASATAAVADSGPYEWNSGGLVADIQGFLDSPATNFGWIILGNESASSTAKRFATREETIADRRPMLLVEYTPIPAPPAALILAFSAAHVMRRRRG